MKEEKLRNIENESLLNLAKIKIRGIGNISWIIQSVGSLFYNKRIIIKVFARKLQGRNIPKSVSCKPAKLKSL